MYTTKPPDQPLHTQSDQISSVYICMIFSRFMQVLVAEQAAISLTSLQAQKSVDRFSPNTALMVKQLNSVITLD